MVFELSLSHFLTQQHDYENQEVTRMGRLSSIPMTTIKANQGNQIELWVDYQRIYISQNYFKLRKEIKNWINEFLKLILIYQLLMFLCLVQHGLDLVVANQD